jgi:hypothetical protein
MCTLPATVLSVHDPHARQTSTKRSLCRRRSGSQIAAFRAGSVARPGMAALVASCAAVGCRFDYFAMTRLVPVQPPLGEGGGVGWDGATPLSKDLFVEASTPMAYSEAWTVVGAISRCRDLSIPCGDSFATGGHLDLFGECASSFPDFDCTLRASDFGTRLRAGSAWLRLCF